MTEWSRRRLVDHIVRGEAVEAETRQQAKDCLWNNAEFLRIVVGELGKLGALTMA